MESFEDWLERQHAYAAQAMLMSISRTDLVKTRQGFNQSIRPHKGSILASPVLADWNPDPDYFFHWYRDSAVIVDALRLLFESGAAGSEALTHLHDFARFSLALRTLDGRALVAAPGWREKVREDFVRFLRPDAELTGVQGERVAADTRVNPDGSLDISRWARPQHDGAPLRALALLRWAERVPFPDDLSAAASALIRSDLAVTAQYALKPAYDMWEEEEGLHYHTLCVSAAALEKGAHWLDAAGEREPAQAHRAQAQRLRCKLDELWLPDAGYYRSRILSNGSRSAKELDISVILAAIHAALPGNTHNAQDPRSQATLAKLEDLFASAYPINRERPADRGVAMGRYAGDVYFSGGAYYFSTLGAAEFCYRAALASHAATHWIARGDAFLATVRAYTPSGGEMSEQFDQRTGEQTSAKHLAWSYAAFISCLAARRESRPR